MECFDPRLSAHEHGEWTLGATKKPFWSLFGAFLEQFLGKNRSCCQDRLGLNIGKVEKKGAFFAGTNEGLLQRMQLSQPVPTYGNCSNGHAGVRTHMVLCVPS